MRTIVYAAAVYATFAGCAEAFAPLPVAVPRARGAGCTQLRMSEDPAAVLARMNAMMRGETVVSPMAAASSLEASYKAPAATPAPAEDAGSVVARVNAMTGGPVAPAPSPTWRWSGKDLGGYNPKGRSAFRSSSPAVVSPEIAAAVAEDPAAVLARVMAMMK